MEKILRIHYYLVSKLQFIICTQSVIYAYANIIMCIDAFFLTNLIGLL
jgi:hypothetical protein